MKIVYFTWIGIVAAFLLYGIIHNSIGKAPMLPALILWLLAAELAFLYAGWVWILKPGLST